MVSIPIYLPHEDIKILWDSTETNLTLSLPWISIVLDIDPKEKQWIKEAVDNLYEVPTHLSVQRFLEPLKEYNVAYYAPQSRPINQVVKISNELHACEDILLNSPCELVTYIAPDLVPCLQNKLPKDWIWNLEELLNKSNIYGTSYYDPLSIGSLLIGKQLGIEARTKKQRSDLPKFLDSLRLKDEETFFKVCRQLIAQTHYVTSRFEEYAPLALESFREATQEIEAFIREEKGHDKLMSNSLNMLGCENPSDIDVLPVVVALMELLKLSADKFPLAFSCLISFFEGISYGESDPIADVLLKSSRPEAGKGYQTHFNINKNNQHKDAAFCLLKKLPLQNKFNVELAARVLELAASLGNLWDVSLVNGIQE